MKILAYNKRARYDYEILEHFEAGLVLTGREVKSIRDGNMSLNEAFITLRKSGGMAQRKNPELYLIGAHVGKYQQHHGDYDPTRPRKLLLNKKEIASLLGKKTVQGLTLVPISVYTKHARLKLEFVLARGKKTRDKRETIKRREIDREMRQRMKQHQ